jgi:hypothetical protein
VKINPTNALAPRDIFLKSRQGEKAGEPTQQGLGKAKELLAQYGSGRQVVVAGDAAVALKSQTFSEMEAKFGKAREIEKGVYVFNSQGGDLIANWYKTAMEDEGYGAADKNKDGIISNRESANTRIKLDFDAHGNFFLSTPRRGEVPDNNNTYITVNDAVERDIASDTDKDGVISKTEIKAKEVIDIDLIRLMVMGSRGQNPDGSFQIMDEEGFTITTPDLATGKKKSSAAHIGDKLRGIEAQILALRGQGIDDGDPKIKQLQAAEKAALAELRQSGEHQPVDVKA